MSGPMVLAFDDEAPLAAALAGRAHADAAGVVRVDLADHEHLVAPHRAGAQRLGERLAHHLLGAAFAVHLGGVDHAVADLQREAQRRHLARPLTRALAHAPGAEAERGAGVPIGKADVLHGKEAL